jgi:DNA polymerase-3 subunit delta'
VPLGRLVGQDAAVSVLRRALVSARVPTAYLFTGPAHVGKATLATAFAQAANCDDPHQPDDPTALDACGVCSTCTRIAAGRYPDFHTVGPRLRLKLPGRETQDAEGALVEARQARLVAQMEGALIDLEAIDSVVAEASRAALEARRRVFLVENADTMNEEAANHLLKTLEEPPAASTFVLTTSRPEQLLPTILSRCQEIRLQPMSTSQLREAVAAHFSALTAAQQQQVVALGGGAYGRATALVGNLGLLELRRELLEQLAGLPDRQPWEAMRQAEVLLDTVERWWLTEQPDELGQQLLKAGHDRVIRTKLKEILEVMEVWFRDLLVLDDPERIINQDFAAELRYAAGVYGAEASLQARQELERTRGDMENNANLRLALEVLFIRLLRLRHAAPLRSAPTR